MEEAKKRSDQIAKVYAALDSCGIDHNMMALFNEAAEKIAAFCTDLQARAMKQALYDIMINVPAGVLTPEDIEDGNHAIISGAVGAIGLYIGYDSISALEIAARIVEDVNGHEAAAEIRALAEKE